jgi:phosphate transport system substrate-binding protein
MRTKATLIILSLILALCACSSNKSAQSSNNVELIGAGSTFVYPIMNRWIADFQQQNPNVKINYQSIGSGGGIQQLKKGLVDFGASDAALDDNQLKEMPPVVQIPESAGPVCITYNLPELKQPLKLSPNSLAGIFLGTIKNWQDPALKKDNPDASLPKDNIVVAHRSESSGTTNIFTNYLDAVSPEWHGKVGKGLSVNWPAGVGGKGSEGVTGVVKQTPGGIGYVELIYATENQLLTAEIKNAAGKYVPPSVESASAAVDAFSQQLSSDVRTPIVNPPASVADAYPISGLTFLLVPKQPKDPAKGQAMTNFVKYVLTTGQDQAAQLHYSKLPPSLQQADQQLLSQVSGQGGDNKSPGGQ